MRLTKAGISRQLARWLETMRAIEFVKYATIGVDFTGQRVYAGDLMAGVYFYLQKPFKKQSRHTANTWLKCALICNQVLIEGEWI